MHHGARRYQKINVVAASPQQTEIAAFNLVIQGLEAAMRPDANEQVRIKALGQAHNLWSLLVRDLAHEGNALPDALKAQLISLGLWVMRYSTQAILKNLPLQPLLEVCRNVLDGLLAQKSAMPEPAQPAVPPIVAEGTNGTHFAFKQI